MIESLAVHLRYVELDHTLLSDEMFSKVLDVLSSSLNFEILQTVLEIIKEMIKRGRTKMLE